MESNPESTSLESKRRTGLEQSKLVICCEVPGGPEYDESPLLFGLCWLQEECVPGLFGHIEVSLLPGGSQPLVLVQHSLFHPRAEPKAEKGLRG